ncbi:SDR family oxidoreductase [Sphingomonas gei]|uniref:SDR family oxidoreductase n=1 Tax=Sphingomonas gei TaxID=1395960 RepID=A0A4S1XGJ9_9SPHN|nr:SDR family oxidoreductase [Sphingomonas gei]TGX55734.1 SDR family oxidoreductase [Sphingomonas gei]
MKIVVIGGSGRIGTKLVANLRQEDCRVFEASRRDGVDTVSGAGLAQVLEDTDIVVDVSNSPTLTGEAPLRFFEASGRNLMAAGRAAGVRHHIALSIVGSDRLAAIDYFRAKQLQEAMIEASGIPYTIVRSTQFFEFIRDVVQDGTTRDIPISPALVQPIAGEDVADALADATFGDPRNGRIEIAGPEQFHLDWVAAEIATALEDNRRVVADVHARYFGAELQERSLLPGPDAYLASSRFEDWLREELQPEWAAARTR